MNPDDSIPITDDARRLGDLLPAFRAAVADRRDAELRLAHLLARLGDGKLWEAIGCANVGEFGERHGIAAVEARALLDLGRALRVHPDLEAEIRSGDVTVAAASCVSEVLTQPAMIRPDDDWRGWARDDSLRTLRRRVRERREQVRIGDEPACAVTVFVRSEARDDFERAREIASSREGRTLTPGETFETVVDHYLETFDFARVMPGARRAADTRTYHNRYVPMAVRREIFARQGFRCAVPFCDHSIFLEKAHLVAHASGGHREADNLILLCTVHHTFFDGGIIRMEGTASKPVFRDREGWDLADRGPDYTPHFDDEEFRGPDDLIPPDDGRPSRRGGRRRGGRDRTKPAELAESVGSGPASSGGESRLGPDSSDDRPESSPAGGGERGPPPRPR
ncbi:MAG: HNH endonuclease [Planctomycetia bacterium]|nr:HNH endonuclease [Planctomycetia bacterium]